MANKNFIVQNGLTVGGLTIDATTGDITTVGNIVTTGTGSIASSNGFGGLNADKIYSSDSNVSVTADSVFANIAGTKITEVNAGGLSVTGNIVVAAAGGGGGGTITALTVEQAWPMRINIGFVSDADRTIAAAATSFIVYDFSGDGWQIDVTGTPTPTNLGGDLTYALRYDPGNATATQTGTGTQYTTTISAGGGASGAETTSTTTGALIVSGGAAIDGNAYVAHNLYIGSTSFDKNLTTPTIIAVDNGSNYAQIAMINSSGNGSADFAAYADNGSDTGGWVDVGIAGSTFSDSNYGITKPHDGYLITRPLDNTYGGNLVIGTSELGTHKDIVIGVGSFGASSEVARFHGNVSTNGTFTVKYPTVSSSTTTGALVVTGGVGVGGDMRVAGNIYAASLNTVTSSQLNVTAPLVYLEGNAYPYTFDIGLYSHFVGGPANVYTHTGVVRSYTNGYYGFFSNVKSEPTGTVNWTDAGLIWDTIKVGGATLANTTAATSTTSGALTVAGGAGIAGAVYIGGNGTNAIVHTGHILPSANITYNLGSSTAWYGSFYGVATQAKYADLAENYQADAAYKPGQVVEFGGVQEITIGSPDSTAVAGVISTNPAHLMNGGLTGLHVLPVALTGRVPCNVIGPVKKGDLMISAGFGYAKASKTPQIGQVIGKALENFNGAKGQIEVVVGRL